MATGLHSMFAPLCCSAMSAAASHWDQLHDQRRFRPVYPNENVVRFLIASTCHNANAVRSLRFLDIGVGAGRHTRLAIELGLASYGADISYTGLHHARQRLQGTGSPIRLVQGSMLALPFPDNSFDLALGFGVFYYGTRDQMRLAIAEMRRVLAVRGRGFVVLRTHEDYRFGKGEELEPNTFRLSISDTNEFGTIQHFVTSHDVVTYFSQFTSINLERTETTFAAGKYKNSDWLITVEK
jgi:ubiquinone/menaquinone biosynthesis C-methylase UbiE